MSIVRIPGKMANKANQYQVHIHPSLWKIIQGAVTQWKDTVRMSPWWIAPKKEVEAYESEVAWRFLAEEKREWLNNEPLSLTIRLINQRTDCDAIKAIGDAIQKSGRITNDRQFRKITVMHIDGKIPYVEIEVESLLPR